MARIEERRTFSADCSTEAAQEALIRYFNSLGARMRATTKNYLEASTGSQAGLRVKGAGFTTGSDYPMRTSVALSSKDARCIAEVTFVDELGLGLKIGLKKRYLEEFSAKATALEQALSAADSTEGGSAELDAGSDFSEQLARLATLHGTGALSDEEFASAKSRVLDS